MSNSTHTRSREKKGDYTARDCQRVGGGGALPRLPTPFCKISIYDISIQCSRVVAFIHKVCRGRERELSFVSKPIRRGAAVLERVARAVRMNSAGSENFVFELWRLVVGIYKRGFSLIFFFFGYAMHMMGG